MLEIIPVPALGQHLNYIWIIKNGRMIAIVDPGEAAPVMRRVAADDLIPTAILITHHHWDHVDGIQDLVNEYALPVYTPKTETVQASTHAVGAGDVVALPQLGLEFQILDVPGHTNGAIAYYINDGHDLDVTNDQGLLHESAKAGIVFSGDTLFTAGCGRLFEGTPDQMFASLEQFKSLPPLTRLYCGHEYTLSNLEFARQVEPNNKELEQRYDEASKLRALHLPTVPSTLKLEWATNPFLRCDKDAVIQAAKDYAGKELNTPVQVFAVLRQWKDQF